jgi:hypothetical protein
MKDYRVLCVNTWVKTGFMLALVILAGVNLANFDLGNAASSAPSAIKDGAYMWYRFVDFDTNSMDYTYVEFVGVHEDTAGIVIRTQLPNLNESEWSQHPPSYGYLDLASGDLTFVGGTDGAGFSFWTNPNAHLNATSGYPPDNQGYARVDCFVVESEQERSWYDKATGVLVETIFVSGALNTGIVTLYQTNIPVGRAADQWIVPVEISAYIITYATVAIGLATVVAIAAIGIRRFRKRKRIAQGVLAKQCPLCRSKNRDDAVFCSRCGSSLAAPSAPMMRPEIPVSVAPVMGPEPSVSLAPFIKAEPPAPVVTPRQEWVRVTASPVETRNVCKTCGHVNPDWITIYCVRCGTKLRMD